MIRLTSTEIWVNLMSEGAVAKLSNKLQISINAFGKSWSERI